MNGRQSAEKVLNEAKRVLTVWEENPEFSLGPELTRAKMTAAVAALEALDDSVEKKRVELAGMIRNRDDDSHELHGDVVRVRGGFRAFFGPDSVQYGQAGGTRTSERKPAKQRKSSSKSAPTPSEP